MSHAPKPIMRASFATCPSDDELTAYVEGRAAGDEASEIDAHIDGCDACRELLVGLAHAVSTAGGATPGVDPTDMRPGTKLGRYVVRGRLGAGAMGIVFEALDPELERRVAIKVVHTADDLVTPRERARMLREAQAMARMSHPNIVPVLAVGTVDDVLYVVMELVEGTTLRVWLAAMRRPWRSIVRAYVAAGRALAAAHAAGVVHRDFKPDNVLVGHDGRIRVIDFGLARLAGVAALDGSDGTDAASVDSHDHERTAAGVVLGTPAYMPPEQLLDAGVDARADQFALAVSLWEGLFGVRPFPDRSLLSRVEMVEERELRRPRGGARVPARLRRALARALAPGADERFADMDAFVHEIERAAAGGRRRVGLALAAVGVAVAATIWAAGANEPCTPEVAPRWDDGTRERMRETFARVDADGLGAVERTLDDRSASWHDAHARVCAARDRAPSARAGAFACLDVRRLELDAAIDVIQAGDADVVGHALEIIARLPAVEPCVTASDPALALLDPTALVEEGRALRSELARARALGEAGQLDEATSAAQAVHARALELGHDAVRVEASCRLGALRNDAGQPSEAVPLLESAYFGALEIGHDEVATEAALELAEAIGYRLDRTDDGARWLEHAASAIERRGSAVAEAELLRTRSRLALRHGDATGAVGNAGHAVERWRELAGGDDPRLAAALDDLGIAYSSVKRYDDALARALEALAMRERLFGPTHVRVAYSLNNVANVLLERGDVEAAIDYYEWALASWSASFGAEHYTVAAAYNNIGAAWGRLGEPTAAHAAFERALPGYERFGPDHPDLAGLLTNLGFSALESGDALAASDALERALSIAERHYGADHFVTRGAAAALAHAATQMGAHRRAIGLLERALATEAPLPGYDDSATARLWILLGENRLALGRKAAAADALATARRLLAATASPHPAVADAAAGLARALELPPFGARAPSRE